MSEKKQLGDGFYKGQSSGGVTRFIAVKGERSVLTWRSESGKLGDIYATIQMNWDGFDTIEPVTREEFFTEVEATVESFKKLIGD